MDLDQLVSPNPVKLFYFYFSDNPLSFSSPAISSFWPSHFPMHPLPRIRAHFKQGILTATTMSPPLILVSHCIPQNIFDLMAILKEANGIIPHRLFSSVPRQTLLKLEQDPQLAVQNSQVNMLNPKRHFLWISDISIPYLTDTPLGHRHDAAACTAIASVFIASGTASKLTFPDAPFSDTFEETSLSEIP